MTTATTPLPGAKITAGPQAWQVLQREADGRAPLTLAGCVVADAPSTVEVRVAREYDQAPAAGCDWQDAEMRDDNTWRITLRVPTGGLYRAETRVRTHGAEWRNAGDKIWHLAVGDLWVIAGQSNAVGYGHGAVVDPPQPGVSLFGMNDVWRMATHPIFDATETRYPANRDGGWVDVSPWLSFGRELLQATGVPVGLIPTALGGSPLWAWDPGDAQGAYLYDNMAAMIAAAGGRVAGMVWYQGCSDTGDEATAGSYLARFTRFIAHFRAQYGAELPVITAQLNRYLDGAPEGARAWALVREAQRQAALTMPRLAVVPTLDLGLSDAIHTSAVGNVLLGQRCARAALGIDDAQAPGRAVDVEGARFTDGSRTRVRLRFQHVTDHLVLLTGAPKDFTVEDAAGTVPIEKAWVEEPADVLVQLARPAAGRTVCHNMFGANPVSTLRDHLQQPVLAFTDLPVDEPEG